MKVLKRLISFSTYLLICISLSAEETATSKVNKILQTIPVKASQGVAVDAHYFYAISNTSIEKYEKKSLKKLAIWKASGEKFKHFKHMNSGTVIDGKLYCAHSRFPIDRNDCTVEIWDVSGERLDHEKTIPLERKHGSLTWIDKGPKGFWWMCYAVYGKNNKNTKLVKYEFKGDKFLEIENWVFPSEVISAWGKMSCSGGSWGRDEKLYTTGHDHAQAHVLKLDGNKNFQFVRTEKNLGFYGQAIAWDRSSKKPILWGIVKNKSISRTWLPEK